MGKVIKLTESQLKQVIKSVIKEQSKNVGINEEEMGDMSKGMCKTSMSQLLSQTHDFANADNDAEYYKRFYPKGFFIVKSGEAFEPSPGGITTIRRAFNIDKTILMKEGGRLDVEFKKGNDRDSKISAGDFFTLTCRGGKVMVQLTSDVSGGA